MTNQKEQGLKRSQARASPPNQLDNLLLKRKFHTINSIGEIVRIETFNRSLEKQRLGLLVNNLVKEVGRSVSIVLIDGNIGVNKIKIPKDEFEDKTKTKITHMRALIEPYQSRQFIPVDKDLKFTLEPEKIRKIIEVSMEELKGILKE